MFHYAHYKYAPFTQAFLSSSQVSKRTVTSVVITKEVQINLKSAR